MMDKLVGKRSFQLRIYQDNLVVKILYLVIIKSSISLNQTYFILKLKKVSGMGYEF